MKEKKVYLDNSATTRLDERVLESMKPFFFDTYAVATSEFAYSMGIESRKELDNARAKLADKLGASPEEFIFTSGSTESTNLAIKGVAMATEKGEDKHIVTSPIEDFPVINSIKALEKQGYLVDYVEVDKYGLVDIEHLESLLRPETILVSIQHANQEIGTVQNIKKIGDICRKKDVVFHTDATHTFTRIPVDVKDISVDLVTVSAHTIHGPRGIGGLYIREGTNIKKWMDGGFQESDLRPGVENIPCAVGFARAVELVTDKENKRLKEMRDYLIKQLRNEIKEITLNGHSEKRLPHNVNITFHYVEGESITLHLDMRGIAVSTGSACFSRSLEASHVIMGIGGNHERAHGSVRFSLGRFNKMKEMDYVVKSLSDIIDKLREISPLEKESKGED